VETTSRQPNCANCGAALSGPYCAACGQHAHQSARSVHVLFHDAWHVITHIDGRFWQTMYLLLLRPGQLTQEYFAERRARYLPPVRVYLALSLLFFAFATFAPRALIDRGAASVEDARNPTAAATPTSETPAAALRSASADGGFNVDFNDCSQIKSSFKWLESSIRAACRRQVAEGGKPVRAAFIANIPKMMFVFLPMMALVMLALYWRPRRYYAEHLVFFLHAHAAMFLILLLERALSWTVAALPALRLAGTFIAPAASIYAVWYVYKAVRVYYGQGLWVTLTKVFVVGFAYAIFLTITLGATLVLSALSI
jgi:uncharacterized protein DUF3667